jgi:putative colanic acid biosynthesis acetyltransferase WcaF
MTTSPPPGERIFQRLDACKAYPYTAKEYALRLCWKVVQGTVFRFSPTRAYGWRRFLLRCFGATMQANTGVRPTTRIFHPWLLTVEERSILGDGVVVYNLGPVRIGRHTVISQDVYLCAGTHDYTRADLPLLRTGISIGGGVWIAAQAFICPGVKIGDNAVIGARAVVTGDLPAGMVAAGNPARVIKARTMIDDAGAPAPLLSTSAPGGST